MYKDILTIFKEFIHIYDLVGFHEHEFTKIYNGDRSALTPGSPVPSVYPTMCRPYSYIAISSQSTKFAESIKEVTQPTTRYSTYL